jgi:hypothetical protein
MSGAHGAQEAIGSTPGIHLTIDHLVFEVFVGGPHQQLAGPLLQTSHDDFAQFLSEPTAAALRQ